jgi:hypothetical protein
MKYTQSMTVEPREPPKKPSLLVEFLRHPLRWFFQSLGVESAADALEEGAAVVKNKAKALWLLLVIFALGGLSGCWYKGTQLEPRIEELDSLWKSNNIALQVIQGNYETQAKLVDEKNFQIVGLKADLHRAEEQLDPWKQIAAHIYTNEPPTKQLGLLAEQIQSITNILQLLDPTRSTFDVYFNRKLLSGSDWIPCTITNRHFEIAIKNSGELTLEGVTVIYSPTSSAIAVINNDAWKAEGGRLQLATVPFEDTNIRPFVARAANPLGAGSWFIPPRLTVSTNTSGGPFTAVLEVYASRSRMQRYLLSLTFELGAP